MPRYKLIVEYDGGAFVGWQHQTNGLSIQQVLETAVTNLTGETVRAYGAGRTDAGVHALAQVAHIDLKKAMAIEQLRGGLNHHLRPHPVAIVEVREVAPDFHARFSAIRRTYRYRILSRRAPSPLESGRSWHVPQPLDAERMHVAAQSLVGKHDFTSFRASECQADSPIKTLERITVTECDPIIKIEVQAPSFLHHQVRNITGTLKMVGAGKEQVDFVGRALDAKDRAAAGPTAPAHGLYLVGVNYPT